ncbi:TetR/AcrR family transcriptional regulator [Planomonospora venezuelensis]|uniref:AcrR family transcriptional regulator n=1 Tax=Planomonospora venezuelensis TaxID=1999 RepID=A0A841D4N0_PLAVE|nr:TetR/AcrR family transcriptional regulator [Planomonospora venezuelensis]MBB5964429.1 AcrR family transcriptional regulator [Planomonospora venezuelensis]GIN01977.1 TetR family transcriptional regulator [Planomonospora venezuelensis]
MEEVRRRDREGTRQRILDAARQLFAELGYEHVTMRLIAAEADANIALINRYFGSKRELFAEVLAMQGRFPGVLEGPREELPRRLAEYVADRLGSDLGSPVMTALSRSSASPEIHDIIKDRVNSAIMEPLVVLLPGEDARLRAVIATALIAGASTLHRLYGPEALGSPAREAVVARLTRVFEVCLEG